ncbi:hypothetical protein I3843_01G105800 [Carya illinoinensis]|nr:hypothetical protein I3843_01G105800 [Carya illinoinensis]
MEQAWLFYCVTEFHFPLAVDVLRLFYLQQLYVQKGQQHALLQLGVNQVPA